MTRSMSIALDVPAVLAAARQRSGLRDLHEAGLGDRLERLEGLALLSDRDDVDEHLAVGDRGGDVGELGVTRVGTIGEHEHGALAAAAQDGRP